MNHPLSREKLDRFCSRMTDIFNMGAVNLAMGIGYRLRLFDCLSSLSGPANTADISRKSGLNQRYLREWLGIMATAEVVELTENGGDPLYWLPPEHASVLTSDSGQNNLGVYTQEIPLLTTLVMDKIVEAFHTGQGVSYDNYPRFQSFMTELSDAKHRNTLIDEFLPSVAGGGLVADLGRGLDVCDLGCGEGTAVLLMGAAFPKSRFSGFDLDGQALEQARQKAAGQHLKNVRFVQMDAAGISFKPELEARFDYITAFDAIHDQTRPLEALKSAWFMLKPGGLFSMVDIAAHSAHHDNLGHPMAPFLYTVSLMHCLPVGMADGGAGLGMMWGRETAVAMMKQAGFEDVAVSEIPNDSFNLHFQGKKY